MRWLSESSKSAEPSVTEKCVIGASPCLERQEKVVSFIIYLRSFHMNHLGFTRVPLKTAPTTTGSLIVTSSMIVWKRLSGEDRH